MAAGGVREDYLAQLLLPLTSEEINRVNTKDLDAAIVATRNNLKQLEERRCTLGQQGVVYVDSSAPISEALITRIAHTLPASNLSRLAYEYLGLTTTEIDNASGLRMNNAYDQIVRGLENWCRRQKRPASKLQGQLCKAQKKGLVHARVTEILVGHQNKDSVPPQKISELAQCFLPLTTWTIFSIGYLKLDPSFSAFDMVDEHSYVIRQAIGILKKWKNKTHKNTPRELLIILDAAHSKGLVTAAAPQQIQADYSPSMTTEYEASIRTTMIEAPHNIDRAETLHLPVESVTDRVRRLDHTTISLQQGYTEQCLASIRSTRYNLLFTYSKFTKRWQKNQSLPEWCDVDTAYCDVTNAVAGRGLVAIGGMGGSSNVCLLGIDRKCATPLPDLPRDVLQAGVHCTQDGELYVVDGGYESTAYRLSMSDMSSSTDGISGGGWYQLPDIIHEVTWPIVLSDNTHLYALGGAGSPTSVQIYDISISTWNAAPSLPERCHALKHGAVIDGNEIVVFTRKSMITYNTHTYTHTTCSHGIHDVHKIKPVMYAGQLMVCVTHGNDERLYTYDRRTHTYSRFDIDVSTYGDSYRFFAI